MERASICPIRDKKHANFNVWTSCTTLAKILEKTQDPPTFDDPHVLILDRGLFDAICWMRMLERLARIRKADREVIERFLRSDDWRKRISSVIVMTASPEDAIEREKGHLPVEEVNGSIMNKEVLQQVLETTRSCVEELNKDFRIHVIDTSFGETKGNPKRTAEIVADIILSLIEEQLQEEVLTLPKNKVGELFGNRLCLAAQDATILAKMFIDQGEFKPRDQAEENRELVQALPIVIVRNASGDILRLRRKERSIDNPLHQKIAIWAGGHVRREDAINGDAIIQCAMRELVEELRLNVEPRELRMIGAVYLDTGGSTSKHVGIAFEWKAKTDDVAVALSSAEFFERRGTSLSGSFVSLERLSRAVESKKNIEPWSAELVRECLAKDSFDFSPRLL